MEFSTTTSESLFIESASQCGSGGLLSTAETTKAAADAYAYPFFVQKQGQIEKSSIMQIIKRE